MAATDCGGFRMTLPRSPACSTATLVSLLASFCSAQEPRPEAVESAVLWPFFQKYESPRVSQFAFRPVLNVRTEETGWDLLADAMQDDPDDRGVEISSRSKYNNAFWATEFTPGDGYDCSFWVPHMADTRGMSSP